MLRASGPRRGLEAAQKEFHRTWNVRLFGIPLTPN